MGHPEEPDFQRGTIRLVLVGIAPERIEAVKLALQEVWDFTAWDEGEDGLEGIGEDWILYDMDYTLQMLVRKVTTAAQSAPHIEAFVQTSIIKVDRWDA